jgi:hypothetical protein
MGQVHQVQPFQINDVRNVPNTEVRQSITFIICSHRLTSLIRCGVAWVKTDDYGRNSNDAARSV